MLLNKVNDTFYNYFDNARCMLFTLKKQEIGVWGAGKSWCLSVTFAGVKQCIASFVTQDDGHLCYLEGCEKRLWQDDAAIHAANKMVENF